MNRFLTVVLSAAAIFDAASAFAADQMITKAPQKVQSQDSNWTATFNTETRYFWWDSSRAFPTNNQASNVGGAAQQVYTPYGFELDGHPTEDLKVENEIRSGYVNSRQSSGGATGSYSGPVDTSVASTATYLGLKGVQPFASINVNIPTGKSALFGNDAHARLDSDVVDTPTFGQGLNVGPVVGVNLPFAKSLIVSISGGYTYQGPFDREASTFVGGVQGINRLKPGDDTTVTANVKFRSAPWTLSASGSYMTETGANNDGVPSYKSGDRMSANASARYAWNADWSSKLGASFTHQNKNNITLLGLPGLFLEAFNSNSNVTTVKWDTTYSHGPWSAGPVALFMFRDHNAYDVMNATFLPQKTKWSAGAAASYDVTKQVTFNGRVEHMWLRENPNPGTDIPAVTSQAWLILLGGTGNF